jgi:DUF2945 family protein|tara:strand:+ start:43526 stop:43744 length:219 start_codon:yes stop_codon:yes gene_type:complete
MIRKGSKVMWKWGSGEAEGKVIDTFSTEITKTIKGSKITRKGEKDNEALYIEQANGDKVLKLENEVNRKTKD